MLKTGDSSISFQEFCSQAKSNKLITNYRELFADLDTPVSIYAKLKEHSADAFLFESVLGGEQIGRYSLIGYKVLDKIIHFDRDGVNSYSDLEKRIEEHSHKGEELLPFFYKGYLGYFSFESVARVEPSIKSVKSSLYPEAFFVLVGSLVVFDHVKQKLYLIDNLQLDESKRDDLEYLQSLFERSNNDLEELKAIIDEKNQLARLDFDINASPCEDEDGFESNTGKEAFMDIVQKTKEHIFEGDVFQAVVSHKFKKKISIDPLLTYRILRTINPSPYLFIFNFNYDGSQKTLVGSSPEMLVKTHKTITKEGNKEFKAEIRPIAGTYRRGKNLKEDEVLAAKLMDDPKERAEHVMLIDLARNDLGRVCEAGSVDVPRQMFIEAYSHVLHIVSSVTGLIKTDLKEKSGLEALRACFPAGTLSGAPKVEAIKIITELEKESRGPYGGTIGYYALDGGIDTAIMIRTLLIEEDEVTIQAGAGVVADSDPESEWQETFNKAAALKLVVNLAAS